MSKWFNAVDFIVSKDILTITETKLDSSISDEAINPHNYFINRSDRNTHGGGVLTYINPALKPICLHKSQTRFNKLGLEVTISKVTLNRDKIIVLGIYRPPNAKTCWFETFSNLIMELSPGVKFIIMGDLNCNLLKPELCCTSSLNLILESANVVQSQHVEPTRITANSANCLDFIAADRSILFESYATSDFMISDHLPVTASITDSSSVRIAPIVKRSFKSVNVSELGAKLDSIDILAVSNAIQLDEQVDSWYSQVISLLDIHAPYCNFPRTKTVTPSNKLTRDLIRQRDSLTRKLKKLSDPTDLEPCINLIKNLNKRIKSRTRATLKSHANSAMTNRQPKEVWKFINKAMFRNPKSSNFGGLPEIACINKYFGDLVTDDQSYSSDRLASGSFNTNSFDPPAQFSLNPLDIYATAKLLCQVNSNSAMGHDQIPATFLKKWAPYLAYNVMTMFNSSMSIGVVPGVWKKANVTAVYKKKGPKNDVANYRPISVLPVLGRLLERAVAFQLQQYCDLFSIIPAEQFGFRKNSSCELAILAALDTWQKDVSLGKLVGALLIDLSKAFDSVTHSLLYNELASIGCDSCSLDWFGSFLSSRSQRVVIGKTTSPWLSVTKGVPQGSALSPLLFNIFVRDLPQACDGAVFQFADDLTNSVSDTDPIALSLKIQASYAKVKAFCDTKKLHINLSKTQLIIFKSSNKKLPANFTIDIGGTFIPPSLSVLILGVTIDRHFTMAAHIQSVVKKCHGLLGVLRRAASYLPPSLLTLVYTSIIRSYLEYNSATFTSAAASHLNKLDVVQKIASRIITNSPYDAHSAPLQSLLGLDSLEVRRHRHVAKLVSKIIAGNTHPFFYNFFSHSYSSSSGSGVNKNLDSKRFSRFGLHIANENSKLECTNIRALEPMSEGRSLAILLSQQTSQADSSVNSSTDLSTATVAPFGHRG